jgi:hypothetical protein
MITFPFAYGKGPIRTTLGRGRNPLALAATEATLLVDELKHTAGMHGTGPQWPGRILAVVFAKLSVVSVQSPFSGPTNLIDP